MKFNIKFALIIAALVVCNGLTMLRTVVLQKRITRLEVLAIRHDGMVKSALQLSTDAIHTAANKKITPPIRKTK